MNDKSASYNMNLNASHPMIISPFQMFTERGGLLYGSRKLGPFARALYVGTPLAWMYLRTVFRSCPEVLEIAEMFFPSRSRSCITHHPSMFSKVRPAVFRRGPMLLVHVGNFRPPFFGEFWATPYIRHVLAVSSANLGLCLFIIHLRIQKSLFEESTDWGALHPS
jgi:hypothetical protein